MNLYEVTYYVGDKCVEKKKRVLAESETSACARVDGNYPSAELLEENVELQERVADPTPVLQPNPENLVCTKIESDPDSRWGSAYFAYFKETPTPQDLQNVAKNEYINMGDFKPTRLDDAVSKLADLERWMLGRFEP